MWVGMLWIPEPDIKCEQTVAIKPKAAALNAAANSNYTHVAALCEIIDNALQAGATLIVMQIDVDTAELWAVDNGRGCGDAAAFHQLGYGYNPPQNASLPKPVESFSEYFQASFCSGRKATCERTDPPATYTCTRKERAFLGLPLHIRSNSHWLHSGGTFSLSSDACTQLNCLFLWQAKISWYGVGGTFAQDKLGDRCRVSSKQDGHSLITVSERCRVDEQKKIPSVLVSVPTGLLATDVDVGGAPLTCGTEIKISGLEGQLVGLIRTADSRQTLLRNLKEIYFFYAGSQAQDSGYERIRATMERCLSCGVYSPRASAGPGPKDRHVTRGPLQRLRKALSLPAPAIVPTDFQVVFLQDGMPEKVALAQTDCFFDDVCRDASDCFPIHVAVPDSGSSRVVMGGIFYFAFKDGRETRPQHGGFLQQAETQVCQKSPVNQS